MGGVIWVSQRLVIAVVKSPGARASCLELLQLEQGLLQLELMISATTMVAASFTLEQRSQGSKKCSLLKIAGMS